MARFAHSNRAPVDTVAARWKDECLLEDGSLLFQREAIWTAEHAQELVTFFNEDQLEDERSFEETLTTQLTPVSRDATCLGTLSAVSPSPPGPVASPNSSNTTARMTATHPP